MLTPLLSVCLISVLAAAAVTPVQAGGRIDDIELSGLLDSEVATNIVTGDVQKAELIFTPEVGLDKGRSTRLTIIGRLRGDLVDDLEPGQPAENDRSRFSSRLFAGNHIDFELREFYFDREIGDTFLRIGKQQVVWGQADGLKVLDVLNPQSFREFILDDFEDSRIPLWTVNAEIPVGEAMLQFLWIPDRTYDDIPGPEATFAFTSPLVVPETPSGVPVTVSPLDRPDALFADSDVAAKLSAFVGGWDLSLNYAYHYFDRPVVRRAIAPTGVTVRQNYERTHLLGGTFSNAFGSFSLRAEVGYASDRYFLTDDSGDADGVIDSGELSYVLGLDYQGWPDWFVSTQIFQSFVSDPVPGLVRDTVETTATLLVRRDFMNDSLQAELLLIQSLNQSDGLAQASLSYEWRTNIRLKIGADIFYGRSQRLFGQFDDKDRVSMGLQVGF